MTCRAVLGILLLSVALPLKAAPNDLQEQLASVRASSDVTGVTLQRKWNRWEIAVKATGEVAFAGHALPDGHRFYVDLPDCRLNVGQPYLSLSREGFTVRASQFSLDPPVVRIVVQSLKGPAAKLETIAPASQLMLTLDAPSVNPPTQIEVSPLSAAESRSLPRKSASRRVRVASRSTYATRGGLPSRLSPEDVVIHPDAMEAYDDPPVPSDGGSLDPVKDADLPSKLKEGVEAALAGNRRYVWGGDSPDGFDCSGMQQFIYRYAGVKIPRTAAEQFTKGSAIGVNELQPGDLLFFSRGNHVFHVGMYIGEGRMFHAANPRRGLTTDLLASKFYAEHFAGARRFLTP